MSKIKLSRSTVMVMDVRVIACLVVLVKTVLLRRKNSEITRMKKLVSDIAQWISSLMECSVRAFIVFLCSYLLLWVLIVTHSITSGWGFVYMAVTGMVSMFVLGYDFAKGYVPVWWLRLGYGKNSKARMELKNKD